jgi:hypothetical protein
MLHNEWKERREVGRSLPSARIHSESRNASNVCSRALEQIQRRIFKDPDGRFLVLSCDEPVSRVVPYTR